MGGRRNGLYRTAVIVVMGALTAGGVIAGTAGADTAPTGIFETTTTGWDCTALGIPPTDPICTTTTTAPATSSTTSSTTAPSTSTTSTTAAPASTTTTPVSEGGATVSSEGSGASAEATVGTTSLDGEAGGAEPAHLAANVGAPAGPSSGDQPVVVTPQGIELSMTDAPALATPSLVAGPRSTVGVFTSLGALGLGDAQLARIVAPFPVAGPASYGDDFLEARNEPSFHLHEGTDIVAAEGTPVVASGTGVVRINRAGAGSDPNGGNAIRLTLADGTFYYYAHLRDFVPALTTGSTVQQGDILGTVGSTGFSTGPHLHFEVHPGGGEAVNPAPYLDRWLAQATSTARSLGGSTPASADSLTALLQPSSTDRPAGAAAGTAARRDGFRADLASERSARRRASEPDPVPILAVTSFAAWLAIRKVRRSRATAGRGVVGRRGS